MEYLLILCKKNFLEQHNFNPLSEDLQKPFTVYHLGVPDCYLAASNICTEKILLCLFTSFYLFFNISFYADDRLPPNKKR